MVESADIDLREPAVEAHTGIATFAAGDPEVTFS